jgi:hypothetical protein
MISTRSVIFTDANVIKTHALRTRGVIINAEYDFHTLKGDFETYEWDYNTHECEYDTHECDLYT